MAEAQKLRTPFDGTVQVWLWTIDTVDLTGGPVYDPRGSDKTVSVSGTFGGDLVNWEGTLDPRGATEGAEVEYLQLHDVDGNPLRFITNGIQAVRENVYAIRPVRSGTAGAELSAFVLCTAGSR